MGKKTFAIGDIHGMYYELEFALKEIERRSPEGGTVVFLGDYIDRGYASHKVLDVLRGGPPSEKWEWVFLRGNHEDMFIRGVLFDDHFARDCWLKNGGVEFVKNVSSIDLEFYADWLDHNTQMLYSDGTNTYAHAYVAYDATDVQILWARYSKNEEANYKEYVVHGHTPQKSGKPLIKDTRCNLDVGSFFTDSICVGVFEEGEWGPVGWFTVDADSVVYETL